MTAAPLSHGETYGPEWAGMARNTAGSRRRSNNRHQTRPQAGVQLPQRSGGWRMTHGRGLYQEHGGYPARGWRPNLSDPMGVGGRLGGRTGRTKTEMSLV